jgi:hypothetical protein
VVVARVYELKAITPTMTPGTGAYPGAQSVTIASSTPSVTVRYTIDGSEPDPASPVYTPALTIADTRTVKARAYRTGWTSSDSGHASYWISAGTVATPTISPAGGTHTAPPPVTLGVATAGATMRYTLDGTDPTGTSRVISPNAPNKETPGATMRQHEALHASDMVRWCEGLDRVIKTEGFPVATFMPSGPARIAAYLA